MALISNPDHVDVELSTSGGGGGKWYIMQYERNSHTSVIHVVAYETSIVPFKNPDFIGVQSFFLRDSDVLREAQIIYVSSSYSKALEHLQQMKQLGFQKLFDYDTTQPFIGKSMLLVQYNIGLENVMYSIVDKKRIIMFCEHQQSVVQAFVRVDNEKLYPAKIMRGSCNLNELIGALQLLQLGFSDSMPEAQCGTCGLVTMQLQNRYLSSIPYIGAHVDHAAARKEATPSEVSAQTKQDEQTASSTGNETRVADESKANSPKKTRKYTKRVRNDDPSHHSSAELDKMSENVSKNRKCYVKRSK